MAKDVCPVKTHKIKIKKTFNIKYKQKIVCPYCNNSEDFYEVIENATILISYIQTSEGTLEPIEEDVEILGPVKFVCGVCNADLTEIKNRYL